MSDYRDVFVARSLVVQQALQPHLPRSGVDDVYASNDVGDSLQVIVYDDGKLIRDQPVSAADDEVTRLTLKSLRDSALQSVGDFDGFIICYDANGGLAILTSVPAGAWINSSERAARLVG